MLLASQKKDSLSYPSDSKIEFTLPISYQPRKSSTLTSKLGLVILISSLSIFTFLLPSFPSSILNRIVTHPTNSKPTSAFSWSPCSVQPNRTEFPNSSFKCGSFKVPLDYTNSSDERTITLALTLFQSGKEKSSNTILLNPGGPGGSGTSYAYNKAEELDRLLGGGIDILGFDPRGVNLSDPSISCFPKDAFRDRYSLLTNQALSTNSDRLQNLRLVDSMNSAIYQSCQAIYGDLPSYFSTAFVARDVDALREALEEDELWSYFVSWGSELGQHYSQMFPERVGRMMLDGIVNPVRLRRAEGFSLSMLHNITDAWEDGFLRECVEAGPSKCALAQTTSSSEVTLKSLKSRMQNLLDSVKIRPLAGYLPTSGPSILTYSTLSKMLHSMLYDSSKWPLYAQILYEIESSNLTLALTEMENTWDFNPLHPSDQKPKSNDLIDMVICDDAYLSHEDDSRTLEIWAELQRNMTKQAPIGGDSIFYHSFKCRNYPWKARETYRGGFDHKLKNPMLLIAETHDPATPLQNGRDVSEMLGWENNRLGELSDYLAFCFSADCHFLFPVVHHGYGHSSRDRSSCTNDIIRNLFVKGQVPQDGVTHCLADTKPFD